MTSKEALNNIEKLFIGSSINLTQQFEIIRKDLDRLEKLEKENQKLNDFKYMFINCKKLTPLPKIPELENTKKHHKDLEILDILKRNIYVADNTIYATPNELEKDDYKKVKEWFENEKEN